MDHLFDILFDVSDWSDFAEVEHHSDLDPTARVQARGYLQGSSVASKCD